MIKFTPEEAERAVIGSILLDPSKIAQVRAALAPEHFSDATLREIYRVCLDVHKEGRPPDPVIVLERCDSKNVGDVVCDCLERTPSAAHAEYYASVVVEWAARRRVNKLARALARDSIDPTIPISSCAAGLERMQQALSSAADTAHTADAETSRQRLMAIIADSRNGRGWAHAVPGVSNFVPRLMRGTILTIGGRSRHCKTALALAIVRATLNKGGAVVYAAEEQDSVIFARLVSQECNVPYGPLLEGQMIAQELEERFHAYAERLAAAWGNRLHIITSPDPAVIELAVLRHRPWLLVVDTIQRVGHAAGAGIAGRSDLAFGDIMVQLRRIAVDCDCAVIVLSQVKYAEGRPKPPTAADFRETREIIEQSDTALTVYWPRVEDPRRAEVDPDGFGRELHIGCVKRRTGATGTVIVDLDPATHHIGPVSRGYRRG